MVKVRVKVRVRAGNADGEDTISIRSYMKEASKIL
jgi:hypothetical protein